MSDLTYQQQVVYQQQEYALKTVWEANDHLDGKANVLVTGGSIIIGLFAGANFLSAPAASGWVVNALSALIFGAFLAMLIFAGKVWSPKDIVYPGPEDVDTMYNLYISHEVDSAYKQALTDLVNAVDQAKIVNSGKSTWLAWMIYAFIAQMIFLTGVVILQLF